MQGRRRKDIVYISLSPYLYYYATFHSTYKIYYSEDLVDLKP